ncbi:hypothetical protein [Niallia circulans]|uniref:hypothetical protein n=1 Tax=Niallia circulans TaxID=1397 RepID=UPI003514772F
MKKTVLFIISTCHLFGLFACSNQNKQADDHDDQKIVSNNEQVNEKKNKKDVRQVVWEQLSLEQKELIDCTWKNGKVSKITLNDNMMTQVEAKSYVGKEVYLIDFPTKNKSIPNNIIIYADLITFDYIGNGLVD